MAELGYGFLLDDFVGTYEVVAELRQAWREGRLEAALASPGDAEPGGPELARRMSARLGMLLEAQAERVRAHGSSEERRLHRLAMYAAAAVIDEIFVLEVDWAGREAWLDVLLEYRLFRSRVAGQRFFDYAERIVLTESQAALRAELAAVFLLSLRLGFRGKYRGASGMARLDELRRRLLAETAPQRLAADPGEAGAPASEALFPQAYQFKASGRDRRLAPLRPWLRAGLLALVAYLLLSSAVWLAILQPFVAAHGN
ncbi:MAG: DotU family type IV/VI secretion system protein [Rhodocyclaceae bacterium]|nr:DotU family type IV/VI secretion system protein [Rhodocyclaceae bacterium]MBX3668286.1 DotU family type IV/VI secretion system protein [Rhodocyclaceae bacterium]